MAYAQRWRDAVLCPPPISDRADVLAGDPSILLALTAGFSRSDDRGRAICSLDDAILAEHGCAGVVDDWLRDGILSGVSIFGRPR